VGGSRLASLVFALVLLVFAGVSSRLAPFGAWENRIFGHAAWYELDPGSYYVAAAHELAWGEPPLYVGHPGTPWMLVLLAIQQGYHALAAPEGQGFTAFTARHLPQVFLLSKLAATLLHLASFAALFAFARALGTSPAAARLAVLGHATSLPIFYYLTRVSPEPLLLLCFFGAFLALWRAQEHADAGHEPRALVFAALAGAAAVTGAFCKLNLLGPLPFFLLLPLLARPRTRAAAAVFAAVAGVLALLYSQLVDWPHFFDYWGRVAEAVQPPAGGGLARWLPAATAYGAFPLAESGFVALGAAGLFRCLRRGAGRRARVLLVSLYAAYGALLFAYRVALAGGFLPFNYFVLTGAVLAVFFGDLGARAVTRLGLPPGEGRGLAAAAAGVVLLHAAGLFAVVDSRRYDAQRFADKRPVYELIARLAPDERLGIDAPRYDAARLAPRLFELHAIPPLLLGAGDRPSRLREAFEALFVPVDPAAFAANARRLRIPALGGEVAIVRSSTEP
jgi:hypothetical protein